MPKVLSYLATAIVCVLALSVFCQGSGFEYYVADDFLAVPLFATLAIICLMRRRHYLAFSFALGGITAWGMDIAVLPVATLRAPTEVLVVYPEYFYTYGPVLPLAAGLVITALFAAPVWLFGRWRTHRATPSVPPGTPTPPR